MLRAIIVVLGLGLLGLGAGLAWHPGPVLPALAPGAIGALILLGTLFERYRYRRLDERSPGPGWTDTGERFRDPETGDAVGVFFHAHSGERRYVRLRP